MDSRGLKDPEGYKRKIEERERAEERARASGGGPEGGGLKVSRTDKGLNIGQRVIGRINCMRNKI